MSPFPFPFLSTTSNVGFTMFLEQDGSLTIDWLSRSVNGPNPSFTGILVPESLRLQIIEDISRATGRSVSAR